MRSVGGAHFTPPTHRNRRDGLVLDRSVPLSVELAGDDYAWCADSGLESGNPGGGSLRFCQRRQPEQQRPQSHAAIKRGVGPRCSDVWPGVVAESRGLRQRGKAERLIPGNGRPKVRLEAGVE